MESASQISSRTICTCRLEFPLDGASASSMWNLLNIVCFLTIYINGKAGKFEQGISGRFCERECTPSVVHIITSDRYHLVFFQPQDGTNDSSHGRADSITVQQGSRRRFLKSTVLVPHVRMTKRARQKRSACAQNTVVKSA